MTFRLILLKSTNSNKTAVPDLGFSPNTVSVLKSPQCMPSWTADGHHSQNKRAEMRDSCLNVLFHQPHFHHFHWILSARSDTCTAIKKEEHIYRWRKNVWLHFNITQMSQGISHDGKSRSGTVGDMLVLVPLDNPSSGICFSCGLRSD